MSVWKCSGGISRRAVNVFHGHDRLKVDSFVELALIKDIARIQGTHEHIFPEHDIIGMEILEMGV